MEKISVDCRKEGDQEWHCRVSVAGENTTTTHEVRMDNHYYEKLKGGVDTPQEFIEKSFVFLLAREPKESILRRFNIREVARYFPEFEKKIADA